jgi:hypothetical protein
MREEDLAEVAELRQAALVLVAAVPGMRRQRSREKRHLRPLFRMAGLVPLGVSDRAVDLGAA